MIHYAFQFCAAVEDYQNNTELDVSLLDAVNKVTNPMYSDLILKTRDSLRELANRLETIVIERKDLHN